jgi:hypothetical protein
VSCPWRPEEWRPILIDAVVRGLTQRHLAELLGVTSGDVRKACRWCGIVLTGIPQPSKAPPRWPVRTIHPSWENRPDFYLLPGGWCQVSQAPIGVKRLASVFWSDRHGGQWVWSLYGPEGRPDSRPGFYGREESMADALDAASEACGLARSIAQTFH